MNALAWVLTLFVYTLISVVALVLVSNSFGMPAGVAVAVMLLVLNVLLTVGATRRRA